MVSLEKDCTLTRMQKSLHVHPTEIFHLGVSKIKTHYFQNLFEVHFEKLKACIL